MSRLKTQYEAFARYNRWMNERLYALADTLGDEPRKRDVGAFFGSIHRTLDHILLADRIWLSRFGAGAPVDVKNLADVLYPDFAELRRERAKTDDAIDAFVATLDGEKLDATISYTRAGQAQSHPLWWAVGHMFNHQTHHRGQVTTLFKQLGHDPGVTDLLALLREPAA